MDNAFGFTANDKDAPPSRIAPAGPDQTRSRTQPDNSPLNSPGAKPTKQVSGGSQSTSNRGPMSGIESAMSAHADQLHPTGRLKPGQQSRG